MIPLQTTIIGAIASFIIGCITAGTLCWNYQANKYDSQIKSIALESKKAVDKSKAEADKKEKDSQNVISSLNKQNLDASKRLSVVQADLNKYRSTNGSLLVKPDSSNGGVAITPRASDSASNGQGAIVLPANISNFLAEALTKADKCELELNTAKDYAQEIVKFRKEQSKR